MKKHIKAITCIALCIIAIVWMIPTVFVKTTISEIKEYELVRSSAAIDTYKITFSYQQGDKIKTGKYTAKYNQNFIPLVGEQDVCHYLTIWPYPVFKGTAPSPVPPLLLLIVSALIYVCKTPKFLRKKEKCDDPNA